MQSSNNNSSFLFYGVTEGSNSGPAPTTGPFSATTASLSHSSDHISRSNNSPSSTNLPSTPTPVNINPRDGIINYLIYQGLLTPDLSLTISPADLNTILSNREKSTSNNSEFFPVPIDTTFLILPIRFQLVSLNFQLLPNHQFHTPIYLQHAHIQFFPRILPANHPEFQISTPVLTLFPQEPPLLRFRRYPRFRFLVNYLIHQTFNFQHPLLMFKFQLLQLSGKQAPHHLQPLREWKFFIHSILRFIRVFQHLFRRSQVQIPTQSKIPSLRTFAHLN